jgi:hypothetical protein
MSNSHTERLIDEIIDTVALEEFCGARTTEKCRIELRKFSESTLILIRTAAEWNHDAGHPRTRYNRVIFMKNAILEIKESALREVMFFCSRLTFNVHLVGVMQITAGLHLVDDYEEVSDLPCLRGEALDVATALFNVTAAVAEYTTQDQLVTKSHQGRKALCLSDLELQGLITASHQQANDIIAVIRERDSSDAGAIREYLNNGTALGTGVL